MAPNLVLFGDFTKVTALSLLLRSSLEFITNSFKPSWYVGEGIKQGEFSERFFEKGLKLVPLRLKWSDPFKALAFLMIFVLK